MYICRNQLNNRNMRSTFKILFYLNTSKKRKSGQCPVMARITIDGSFAAISLKKNIRPDCWDAENGRATGKTREQLELNRIIAQTETSIREIHDRTVETSGYVTAEQIRNELTGVASKADTAICFNTYIYLLFVLYNPVFHKRFRKIG